MTKAPSPPAADAASAAGTIDGLPFEQALSELEQIVSRLERGDVPLEESIAIFERGERLKKHCDALLKKAEARIEKISAAPGEDVTTAPFDPEA